MLRHTFSFHDAKVLLSPRRVRERPCAAARGTGFCAGEAVRLTRSETLLFKGENFLGARRDRSFTVLQAGRVGNGWSMWRSSKADGLDRSDAACRRTGSESADGCGSPARAESFRDQRYDEARQRLARALRTRQAKGACGHARGPGECRRDHCGAGPRGSGRAAFTSACKVCATRGAALEARSDLLALPLDEGADRLASGLEVRPRPSSIATIS